MQRYMRLVPKYGKKYYLCIVLIKNAMTGTYMLTEEKAKEYLKEALDGKLTLFQRVSSLCTVNCTDPAEVAGQLIDSILKDVINVVKIPWSDKEFFFPYTEEYPKMVCQAIVEKIGPVKTMIREAVGKEDFIRMAGITLRNNVWYVVQRHERWYYVEWDGRQYYNQALNVVSCAWTCDPAYYCMRPDLAAEIYLIMDDMAGYVKDEIYRLFYKVKKEITCRQVEMNSVLAAVKQAGFKYYRLWVNSSRTVALNVRLSGHREVNVTLYPRHIHGMLDVLVNDLQAAERGEKTVLPCRIYEAYGKWDIIM